MKNMVEVTEKIPEIKEEFEEGFLNKNISVLKKNIR